MELKVTRNFSFSKILDKSGQFIKDVTGETAEVVAETATKFINDNKVRPDILPSTKKIKRAKGAPTPDTPLKDTGNLVNTMRVVKDGLEIADYYIYHQEGIGVRRRRFLPFTKDMENFTPGMEKFNEKINSRFAERIRKAMKTSKKIL